MTSELDRLLAEGPRVAPEAPMISDSGSVLTPAAPAGAPAGTTATREARPAPGARGAKPVLGRLWLPLLFATVALVSSAGHGYGWVVPLVIIGFAAFRAWARR